MDAIFDFLGIMDMVFFMSLMSFMGMDLNPMESSMAGDIGNFGATGSESDSGAGIETGHNRKCRHARRRHRMRV